MKFGKTKGTKGLLKLTKFGVATLIFGDIRPQQYLEKQPKYGNLLRRRHFAAKKRPAADALASIANALCVSSFRYSRFTDIAMALFVSSVRLVNQNSLTQAAIYSSGVRAGGSPGDILRGVTPEGKNISWANLKRIVYNRGQVKEVWVTPSRG